MIKGSAHQMSAMTQLQREALGPENARVLLELQRESAPGDDCTTANHAVFVHPLRQAADAKVDK
ncbi:hypothetical protein M885DRAFT_563123 [Pelagophyceae sp. CCMP2097]|nr:hypothetical protein M885DRAFT_563123 [Pelagophyceae sp. CCMP2097]